MSGSKGVVKDHDWKSFPFWTIPTSEVCFLLSQTNRGGLKVNVKLHEGPREWTLGEWLWVLPCPPSLSLSKEDFGSWLLVPLGLLTLEQWGNRVMFSTEWKHSDWESTCPLRPRASFVGGSLFRLGGLRSSVNHVHSLICIVMSRNPRGTGFPNDSCLL